MSKKSITDHLREYIALTLVPNLGAQRIKVLLQKADHPQDVFRMSRKQLLSIHGMGPGTAEAIATFNDWQEVDRVLEQTERIGAQLVSWHDESYPDLLRQIYDPPVLYWLLGNPASLDTPSIAVVGTRKATSYGKKMAARFARELAEKGLTIVSGLAYGIDAEAHRATVECGGTTVAVLGSGIDNVYPSKNRKLAKQIVDAGGAVVSEFPPGTEPNSGNFPIRNRIVSGLTLGTLVVESRKEGGSMITARSALDQNREVFVVPHNISSNNGTGANYLIKTGQGKLVQEIDDILTEINIPDLNTESAAASEQEARWKQCELDELSISICKMLEDSPQHIDALAERLEMPSHALLPSLLELEMQDCVRQSAGKIFELTG